MSDPGVIHGSDKASCSWNNQPHPTGLWNMEHTTSHLSWPFWDLSAGLEGVRTDQDWNHHVWWQAEGK